MTNDPVDRDQFARLLLEEAKRFLEKAQDPTSPNPAPFLHASLLLAFCSLEAHVNSIADDFAEEMPLSPHEIGLLREREVRLEKGRFEVTETPKIVRLDERVKFICERFARKQVDFKQPWWSRLIEAIRTRNSLTHPRECVLVTPQDVAKAIEAIVDTLNAMYSGLFNAAFPAAGLRLDSELDF